MKKLAGLGLSVALFVVMASPVSAENAAVTEVKDRLSKEIDASPNASDAVKTFAKETLLELCTNPVFVQESVTQNAKGLTLDQIKKNDAEWVKAEDELPIQAELMTNACADEIAKIAAKHPAIRETFVMDNQGANVGQNDLTSDYWQGDEPKWQKSYNDGKGGVDIEENKLDRSSNQVMQRVSLPIIDENGKVVGAVSLGLAVDKL